MGIETRDERSTAEIDTEKKKERISYSSRGYVSAGSIGVSEGSFAIQSMLESWLL